MAPHISAVPSIEPFAQGSATSATAQILGGNA